MASFMLYHSPSMCIQEKKQASRLTSLFCSFRLHGSSPCVAADPGQEWLSHGDHASGPTDATDVVASLGDDTGR